MNLLILGALLAVISLVAAEGVSVLRKRGVMACDESVKARMGKWLLVHYVATVDDSSKAGEHGKQLQNSYHVGVPIVVQLVTNDVIPGWIEGLEDACEKSTTEMLVPPDLGYGEDLTVRFEIEILKVSDEEIEEPSLFDALDLNKDGQISMAEFEKHFVEHRKEELDENGNPPIGLFMKEDVNQNGLLNWGEFSGPKGTQPPAAAEAIVLKENADPKLNKYKKGDPFEFRVTPKGKDGSETGDSDEL